MTRLQEKLEQLMADKRVPELWELDVLRSRPSWMMRGACRHHAGLTWIPVAATRPAAIDRCKAVCAECPVRERCLAWATKHGEVGIWGGTTDSERAWSSNSLVTSTLRLC
jgi:WhiB family redox-sensing transcriptional regulator